MRVTRLPREPSYLFCEEFAETVRRSGGSKATTRRVRGGGGGDGFNGRTVNIKQETLGRRARARVSGGGGGCGNGESKERPTSALYCDNTYSYRHRHRGRRFLIRDDEGPRLRVMHNTYIL